MIPILILDSAKRVRHSVEESAWNELGIRLLGDVKILGGRISHLVIE